MSGSREYTFPPVRREATISAAESVLGVDISISSRRQIIATTIEQGLGLANIGSCQIGRMLHRRASVTEGGITKSTIQQTVLESEQREALAQGLLEGDDRSFASNVLTNLSETWTVFESLTDGDQSPIAKRIGRIFPLITAYSKVPKDNSFQTQDYMNAEESSADRDLQLFDKTIVRSVGKKFAGLLKGDITLFQDAEYAGLDQEQFNEQVAKVTKLHQYGLSSWFSTVLLHLDSAKGGDHATREWWTTTEDIDLFVHNKAGAKLTKAYKVFEMLPIYDQVNGELSDSNKLLLSDLGRNIIAYHGLVGQQSRGEITGFTIQEFTNWIKEHYTNIVEVLKKVSKGEINEQNIAHILTDWYILANIIDTASVKEGLYSDDLHKQFMEFGQQFERVITPDANGDFSTDWDTIFLENIQSFQDVGETFAIAKRKFFADRIKRLRKGRIEKLGNSESEKVDNAVFYLPEDIFEKMFALSVYGQLWYAENATAYLSTENQLKMIFLGLRSAEVLGINTGENFNINFVELMNTVRPDGIDDRARQKVVDTYLRTFDWDDLMNDNFVSSLMQRENPGVSTFNNQLGSEQSIGINFKFSIDALAACAAINEIFDNRRDRVEYQDLLRDLQRVYGLTVDQWDRGLSEQEYMDDMDAAMDDKRRSIIEHVHVREGAKVVDLGAGTGKLSAMIAQSIPGSTVIGVDVSDAMITAILDEEAGLKRERDNGSSVGSISALKADVTRLSEYIPPNSQDVVIASSFMHEIGSYVDGLEFGEVTKRTFQEIMKILKPGGRLIVRDFVQPEYPNEEVIIEIGQTKASSEMDPLEFMERFVRDFRGVNMQYIQDQIDVLKGNGSWKSGAKLHAKASDALVEIAAHYSWASSYVNEVKERYSYFPIPEYLEFIKNSCAEIGQEVNTVIAHSYLQPSYSEHVLGRLNFYHVNDGQEQPIGIAPFTGVMVIEKV